jgi:hypothetical protein
MSVSNSTSATPLVIQTGTHGVAHDCEVSLSAQAHRRRDQPERDGALFEPLLRSYIQRNELERAESESTHLALCMLYIVLFWIGGIAAFLLL